MRAFASKTPITLPYCMGGKVVMKTGIIRSLGFEDGSGLSFIVFLYGHKEELYIRTKV